MTFLPDDQSLTNSGQSSFNHTWWGGVMKIISHSFFIILLFVFLPIELYAIEQNEIDWWGSGVAAALEDPDPQVQNLALEKIRTLPFESQKRLKSKISIPPHLLTFRDESCSAAYAFAFTDDSPTENFLRQIDKLLNNRDIYVRLCAADALALKMQDIPDNYMLQILDLVISSSDLLPIEVLLVLNGKANEFKKFTPQLIDYLNDQKSYIRKNTVYALGAVGEISKVADLLSHNDEAIREAAVDTLRSKNKAIKGHLSQIAELLNDNNKYVRDKAIQIIGNMGDAAINYAPKIVELLNDGEKNVRISALNALGKMSEGNINYTSKVAEFINDADSDMRIAAVVALGNIGEPAKRYIPEIVKLLKDLSSYMDNPIPNFFRKMGIFAKDAMPLIVEFFNDADEDVRRAAIISLSCMGVLAKDYIPQIIDLLDDRDSGVRLSAARALGEMGDTIETYLPKIEYSLNGS